MRMLENKISLILFIVDQRQEPTNVAKLQDKSLFVTCGETCHLITKDHAHEIQALQTTQKETDT